MAFLEAGSEERFNEQSWETAYERASADENREHMILLARLAVTRTRFEEADRAYARATELSFEPEIQRDLARERSRVLLALGRFEEARDLLASVADLLEPDDVIVNDYLYLDLLYDGDPEAALRRLEPLIAAYPEAPTFKATAAFAHWRNGDAGTALTTLEALPTDHRNRPSVTLLLALVKKTLGEAEAAADLAAGVDAAKLSAPEAAILADYF